jgi:hypothetical protein
MNQSEPATKRLKRLVRRLTGRRPPARKPRWVSPEANPPEPHALGSFRLFAVVGTWMEADVIESTVANALTQGCERVYLVDNDSPDETVAAGVAAGAMLGRNFSTEQYDEQQRLDIINDLVDEVTEGADAEHVWWLYLDADEFPHGPGGLTIRDYLATLDARFRVVGARFLNHYPTAVPEFVPGKHPLDFQPMCEELPENVCRDRHRKHPLLRHDRGGDPIKARIGFHVAETRSGAPLLEPDVPIIEHHFPFRVYTDSRARLDALCGSGRAREDDIATGHMLPRFRSFEAVYRHEWDQVENFLPDQPPFGVTLRPWTEFVGEDDRFVQRWYVPDKV